MYPFGKMMRKLIVEYDTTQADIVRATGIKKQNLSWICMGKTQYPSVYHYLFWSAANCRELRKYTTTAD